jgi:CspA family cold shock protein
MPRDACRDEAIGRQKEVRVMPEGTVKWFSNEKSYGFVSQDTGDEDLFVRYSTIEGGGFGSLEEGGRVSYEVERGKKGPQARDVRVL